jgi:spore germination protein GerM
MVEPTGHCPYVGLKQNRAIRFASPTSEHRCYVSGEPLDIPVDQATYCLSQGHVHCPLYMGLTVPTTSDAMPTVVGGVAAMPPTGLRGWYATLSRRDRTVYAIMIVLLAIIVSIYLFVGLQAFLARNGPIDVGTVPTGAPSLPATGQPALDENPTANLATDLPPTPTDLPTNTAAPQPTEEPTAAPIILQPTSQATQAVTEAPTNTSVAASTSVATSTSAPTVSTSAPTAASTPTTTSASATPSAPQPSATPRPTTRPPLPPTQPPTARPPLPPTQPPAAAAIRPVTLYFSDATGSVLVPVRRNTEVQDNRIAEAAMRELIAGPRNGLNRLVNPDTKLLGITIANRRATVNFDRDPGGLDSIVFTLTDFSTVSQVQIQVNGTNLGGVRARPVLNPINPQNLKVDYSTTEFLPLYFPAANSAHDIRLIRMVPKTKQTAEATVRAILEGPGPYGNAVRQVIPAGTELRGIKINNGVVLVDFTQPFANAGDLGAAMRTVVESLTTLPTVSGVQFLVEGRAFADGKIFPRPAINPE